MDGASRQRLTDVVTLSRIPIALMMLLFRHRRTACLGLFALGVATDVVDGPMARRLGTQSERGARLDSVADAALMAASAATAVVTMDAPSRLRVGRVSAVVATIRLATLVLTRRRFQTWAVMHTRLNKAAGLGLASVNVLVLVRGRVPRVAFIAVAALAGIAAIEELVIVARASDYDVDRTSVFDC